MQISLEVDDEIGRRLLALTHPQNGMETVEHVVMELIDHAQQGVYRPGAWERAWVEQVFGDLWLENVETDPTKPVFDRPRPMG